MLTPREIFLQHVAQTSQAPLAIEIVKAEGIYLFDSEGKMYYDLISGISVSSIGHSHPSVINAITEQINQYMHLMVYGEFIQYPQVKLAHRLAELLPKELQCVFFVNSGSEAVEGAIKLAKRFTGRHEVVAMRNAYHGSTHGALSLMGNEEQKRAFYPLIPGIQHIEFNNIEHIERITKNHACVIVEPVQGEAGVIVAQNSYLVKVREACHRTGALLIFDEIQTGMGRTGCMFAFEKYGVVPDILLLAKAFGGGLPLGAFISSKDVMQCLTFNPPLGHITTFGGHPVSCSSALSAIDVIQKQDIINSINKKANLFYNLLSSNQKVKEIRYSGLIMAVELGDAELVQKCIKLGLERGIILDWFLFCSTAFRIAPPLTISFEEIKDVCSTLYQILDEI